MVAAAAAAAAALYWMSLPPQIQRLMLSFPKTSHGYQYILISLGTALALGLLVYGVPVWTL